MRVLVCGGRHYQNKAMVRQQIDMLLRSLNFRGMTLTIIHGACPTGADALADEYARELGLEVLRFPADWNRYGKRAGYLRNQRMLDEAHPDMVLAFPGKRGTTMMKQLARRAGVMVVEVER